MNDNIADEFEHAGVPVKIVWQDFADENDNPRSNQTNLGVMLCGHPHYELGDEQAGRDGIDTTAPCPKCEGYGYVEWYEYEGGPTQPDEDDEMTCPECEGRGEVELGLFEYLKKHRGATVVLPLFLLDHSGLSMRAGSNMGSFDRRNRFVGDEAGWDTSSVGVIFDTNETREETGAPLDSIERQLRNEVEEYDSYLRGEIYGYIVGDDTDFEESCWGFVGDIDYARSEAKLAAEAVSRRIARENTEAAHWAARDTVTV